MRQKAPLLLLIASAFVFLASLAASASFLPAKVASHFDELGNPNGWMPRSEHLFLFALFGLGVAGLVIGICHALRLFPSSLLNVPNPAYWRSPEHYPEACRILEKWSLTFGSVSLLWATGLHLLLIQANLSHPAHLSGGAVAGWTGLYLVALGALVVKLWLAFRHAGSR